MRLHKQICKELQGGLGASVSMKKEISVLDVAISDRERRICAMELTESKQLAIMESRRIQAIEAEPVIGKIQKKRGRKPSKTVYKTARLRHLAPAHRQRILDIRRMRRDMIKQKEIRGELKMRCELASNPDGLSDYLLDVCPFLNTYHAIQADLAEKQKIIRDNIIYKSDGSQVAPEFVRSELVKIKQEACVKCNDITWKFIKRFKPETVPKDKAKPRREVEYCPLCETAVITDKATSTLICPNEDCSYIETDYLGSTPAHCSYDNLKNMTPSRKYTYKRINHFREFLRKVQGKGKMSPPHDLVLMLRAEFHKCHTDTNFIKPCLVRKKLRKLNQSEFYDMVAALTMILNPNYEPLDIPPEREEKLCFMFMQAEPVYEGIKRFVRKNRRNFMSYPVSAFKLCQLNGWDEYTDYFTLLKSDPLLIEQDNYWKMICIQLEWSFIPTIGNVLRSSMFRQLRMSDPDTMQSDNVKKQQCNDYEDISDESDHESYIDVKDTLE